MIQDTKTLQKRLKELDGSVDWKEIAKFCGTGYHTIRKFVNGKKDKDYAKLLGLVQIANYFYNQKAA